MQLGGLSQDQHPQQTALTSGTSQQNESKYWGKMFLESICVFEGCFFIFASFSVFVHNNRSFDDYARSSCVVYQSTPVAYVRRNTRFIRDDGDYSYSRILGETVWFEGVFIFRWIISSICARSNQRQR